MLSPIQALSIVTTFIIAVSKEVLQTPITLSQLTQTSITFTQPT